MSEEKVVFSGSGINVGVGVLPDAWCASGPLGSNTREMQGFFFFLNYQPALIGILRMNPRELI